MHNEVEFQMKISLKANKSWFFFDKEVVCLGSCINSEEESEVETIIEIDL